MPITVNTSRLARSNKFREKFEHVFQTIIIISLCSSRTVFFFPAFNNLFCIHLLKIQNSDFCVCSFSSILASSLFEAVPAHRSPFGFCAFLLVGFVFAYFFS